MENSKKTIRLSQAEDAIITLSTRDYLREKVRLDFCQSPMILDVLDSPSAIIAFGLPTRIHHASNRMFSGVAPNCDVACFAPLHKCRNPRHRYPNGSGPHHKWDNSNGDTWDPFWADDDTSMHSIAMAAASARSQRNLAFHRLTGDQTRTG